MKLRDIVRKDRKQVKLELKSQKRKNNIASPEHVDVKADGDGDNAVRGMNDNQGYI